MNDMSDMPLLREVPRRRFVQPKPFCASLIDGDITVFCPLDKAIGHAALSVVAADLGFVITVHKPKVGDRSVGGWKSATSHGERWNYRWKVRSQKSAAQLPQLRSVELDLLEASSDLIRLFLPHARVPLTLIEPAPEPEPKPAPITALTPLRDLVAAVNAHKANLGDELVLRIDDGKLRAQLDYC